MADKVEIKVGFDVDVANFEKQIQELKKEIESADIGKGLDAQLLQKERNLRIEFNKFLNSLNDARKGSQAIIDLKDKMQNLRDITNTTRDAMTQVTLEFNRQNAKEIAKQKAREREAELAAHLAEQKKNILEVDKELAKNEEYYSKLSDALHKNDIEHAKELYIAKQEEKGIAKETAAAEFEANLRKQELNSQLMQDTLKRLNTEKVEENHLIEEKIKGEEAVQGIKTRNIKNGTTQALLNFEKIRTIWIQGIKDFFNNVKKYTSMWINILSSGLKTVSSGFKSLLSAMFNNTKSSLGGIISEFKGLLGIAGGLGLTKLGSEAIKTSNEFKTLGSTSQIIARQMSNAFYEAAGDSYNSLVKLSNGTEQVTTTLRKFIGTWTGQVSLMKAQLTAIGANIGNLLTKVFYPLLVVLNKVLAVVNMLVSRLASLFGFNTAKLGDILGNVGGAKSSNKGLEDYTKSANKASKATKKLSDNTKKAKDNLQGYDKLNNTTTDDLDDLTDKMDDIASGGLDDLGGIFDTDKLFDNLMDELDLIPEWMKDWIDKLIELIKAGDWYNVGKHIGDLVNIGLNKLAEFLSDPSLPKKIDKITDSLTKFANGVLDTVDWKLLGIDLAKGLNLITYSIDSLYKAAIKNGTLDKTGKALHDAFMGFVHTVDAEQAGRAAVSAMRAIIDVVFKALDELKDYEVNAIADKIRDFITGAFDRLTGINEGELKSGAQKVGEIIAKVINIGLQTVSYLINADTAKSLATAISDLLNSAINNIDEERMKSALSGMLQFIGTLLTQLAEDVDVDEFVTKIINTINNSIENGDVTTFVAGLTSFINKFFDVVKRIIKELNWGDLTTAIIEGIKEGGGLSTALGNFAEFVLAPALITALAKGLVTAGEWALVGAAFKGGLGASLGTIAKVGGAAGGILGVLFADIDIYTNKLTALNGVLGLISAAIAGFSIAGIPGAIVGVVAQGLIELDALGKQYPEKVAAVGEAIGEAVGQIIVWFYGKFEEFKQWLAGKMEALGSDIGAKIVEYAQNVLKIYETFEKIKQWFGETITNLVGKAEELKTSIRTKFDEMKNNLANFFKNLVTSAITWGGNIISGLISGITGKLSDLWNTVTNICNGIKEKFANAMQIHSPSKVMEDLGIFIPEGVALGIEDGEGAVDDAMSNMINSMKFSDFYADAYNQTDAFVDDVTSRLQDITTPELDPMKYQANITRNPSQTASMIAQSYSENNAAKASGMMSGIYNRIVAGVGQTGGRNVIVDVYLDKNNKLGQYVIDTMKGNVVMTGGV